MPCAAGDHDNDRSQGREEGHDHHHTTVAPTTTSTTEATVSNGEFTAPTPSVEALAPWDPRSCTASGGEGP